ncbi:MAG: flippase-like domain-containing protein [Bacteroidales bacterium]|nr:flippase-like domain-containing protein [Bacteroidales bacterium]
MKNKLLKTLLGIFVAAVFLFLSLRNQPIKDILSTVFSAKIGYVLLALLFYFISYIARSEKWRIQVENLNYKVAPKTAFYALMLHFFTNSFTIKLGAFVRCGNLRKTASVPFSSCLGSYLSECVFDFLFMFTGILIVLTIKFDEVLAILVKLLNDWGITKLFNNPLFVTVFVVVLVGVIVLCAVLYKKKLIFKKYHSKIKEFVDSVKMTFKLKRFFIFLMWGVLLWGMLFFMNLFLFKALFNNEISFIFVYTLTTFTYAAWLIPSPGGIGSVEYFVLQAFLLFGLSETSALAFGILSNGFTLLSTLFFGFVLIIIQSIFGVFVQKDKNTQPA